MKKLLSIAAMAVILGSSAQADFLRVEAGAGVWSHDIDASINYAALPEFNEDTLGYDKESEMYLWLNIKHPIPVVPNLRLEYTPMEFSGTAAQNFQYKGQTFTATAQSSMSMDQIDTILYYNILDNTAWVTLDLGLDIKLIDFEFKASQGAVSVEESEQLPIPMAYGRVRFEIPATDIGIEADMKYIGYKDSKVSDYRIKVDYVIADLLPIDLGIEIGYRAQTIDIDGDDFGGIDTSAKIDVDGIYAGAMVRF